MANKGQQSNSYKKETKEEIVRKYIEEGISAGALSKDGITVTGLDINSPQGDKKILDTAEKYFHQQLIKFH